MIKKGDRVKFINDTTTGVVSSINGAVANVTVEDGFEIPVLITDLVAVGDKEEEDAIRRMGVGDGTPLNTGRKGRPAPVKEKKKAPQRQEPQYGKIALTDEFEDDEPIDLSYIKQAYIKNTASSNDREIFREQEKIKAAPSPVELTDYDIKLCFVPQDTAAPEQSDSFDLYLVNDSSYSVFYSVSRWNGDKYATAFANGTMEEDSKERLGTFGKSQLSVLLKLQVSLILFKPTNFVPQPAEDFALEISPVKFLRRGSFVENDFFDERVLMFTVATSTQETPIALDPKTIKKAIKDKGDIKPAAKNVNDRHKEPEIVDLHAGEVLESTDGVSPGEILKAQMSRFEIALDLAVRNNRGGKMVFIHGVGSGKLKYEMQKLLKARHPKLRYQDASFREYGYGAIMIYF